MGAAEGIMRQRQGPRKMQGTFFTALGSDCRGHVGKGLNDKHVQRESNCSEQQLQRATARPLTHPLRSWVNPLSNQAIGVGDGFAIMRALMRSRVWAHAWTSLLRVSRSTAETSATAAEDGAAPDEAGTLPRRP